METLVGKKAPLFKAKAVVNGGEIVADFSLSQYLGKKDVVFFFYPLDFTFVCPTELLAFQDKLAEFEKRGTAVVACSIDSEFFALGMAPDRQKQRRYKRRYLSNSSRFIKNNIGKLRSPCRRI